MDMPEGYKRLDDSVFTDNPVHRMKKFVYYPDLLDALDIMKEMAEALEFIDSKLEYMEIPYANACSYKTLKILKKFKEWK